MSLNSILKKELPLRDSLKRKILFIAIVCYSLTAIVFIFGFGAYQWTIDKNGDEIYRFSENYAFGKGVNPYEVMLGNAPQLDVKISDSAGTAPYNFIFYYLLHFSDSNKAVATIVVFCFYILALIGSSIIIYRYVRPKTDFYVALLCTLVFLSQYGVGVAFGLGNYAIFTYFFILLLAYTNFCEKRPAIGGLLLGLGMMKPQTMMPFFVPLIIKRRILIVSISVATVIIAFLLACYVLSTSPIELFKDFSEQSKSATNISNAYCGPISSIGTVLTGGKATDFLHVSFIIFLIFTFIICWKYRNIEKDYTFIIPAAISTVWTYSYACNSTGVYILWAIPIIIDFFSREKISLFRLSLYIITLSIMLAYLPRNTLGLPTSLFPFAEDIYRIFMVFMAFYIVIKRDTFVRGYKK